MNIISKYVKELKTQTFTFAVLGETPWGRGRGGLHERGQELRHDLSPGSVVHDDASEDQETDSGRGRTLLIIFHYVNG